MASACTRPPSLACGKTLNSCVENPSSVIRVRPDVPSLAASYGQINNNDAISTGEVAEMKGVKTLGVGLAVLTVLFGVPTAAFALLLTVGQGSNAKTTTVSMPQMQSGGMGGGMIASNQTATTPAAAVDLAIIHVQKGCHVWSNGTSQVPTMRLMLKAGQMLQVMNQDLDMHRMMEVAGPTQMMLGGPMKQGQTQALTFTKPGVYRFMTKVSPMAGMPDVATSGADNSLRLMVTVA